jgi:hypothetical protein
MHDFQRNASSSDGSPPCTVHQGFAHQVPLPQMRDQNDGPVRGNGNKMKIKKIQCTLSREFDPVRQVRCQQDQDIFQEQNAQSNEIYVPQILELVKNYVEGFLRPSKENGHRQFNTVSYPKSHKSKTTQGKPGRSHEVLPTIAKGNHQPAEANHQYIVKKIPFDITDPGFPDSIQLVKNSGVCFHGAFSSARRPM